MTSRWEQYKQKNGVTPLDLLNPATKKATEELASSRFEVCLSCPELLPVVYQCKQCGCFMKTKTQLASASCPIGKWQAAM